MRRISRLVLLLACLVPLAALAQPQRTFVASNGLDSNPCSLVAACRSFGAAVGAVAAGGEVVVLDSAGYGAVTISKSVSIITPPGIYAGVSVLSATGVTIDGAGIVVALRGLSIANQTGDNGIDFVQGTSLHVENCVISGFATGTGVTVLASAGRTHILDTIIRENQKGVVFANTGMGILSRVRVERNAAEGVQITSGALVAIEDSVVAGSDINIDVRPLSFAAGARVTVARTLVSGGTYNIFASPNAVSATASVTVMDSTIANATQSGIAAQEGVGNSVVVAIRNQLHGNMTALEANGGGAKLILEGNALAVNVVGVTRVSGATIVTRNDNTVSANGTDTAGLPYTSLPGI